MWKVAMSILKYKRVVVQLDSKEQTVTLPKNRTPREPFKMMVSKFQVSFFSGTMLVFRGLLKLLYSSPMSFLASYKKNFSWRFLQGYGSGMRMGVPFPLGVCGISIDLPSTKLTYPLQCWSAPQRPPRRRFKKPIFATQKLKVSWLDDRIPSPKYAPLFLWRGRVWWNPWKVYLGRTAHKSRLKNGMAIFGRFVFWGQVLALFSGARCSVL